MFLFKEEHSRLFACLSVFLIKHFIILTGPFLHLGSIRTERYCFIESKVFPT